MEARGTLDIVQPNKGGPRGGNTTTSGRWRAILEGLGWRVHESDAWNGRDVDGLIALHARRSAASIQAFHAAHPERPVIVAGTGTDLYVDAASETRRSLELASHIVVLQELAVAALPEALREKARVVYQSVPAPETPSAKVDDAFQVLFMANVRDVKDPVTAARAARLLPEESRIRIVHLGGTIDEDVERELAAEASATARFVRRGEVEREEALAELARSHVLLSTSRHEGGANVVSEAIAYDVPVVATAIPGSFGLLGAGYPGTFQVGDARALADLLYRCETDAAFLERLRAACRERASLFDPETERESWRRILEEAFPGRGPARGALSS